MAADKLPALWSAGALNDIDRLWDYYAGLAGRATADKVLREIAGVITTIEAFPRAGRSRDEIRAGLRKSNIGLERTMGSVRTR
jgi:plasmid stabilization system protein ParE